MRRFRLKDDGRRWRRLAVGLWRTVFFAFVFELAGAVPSAGEPLAFRRGFFTHFDGSDGLPSPVVRQVLQDRQGFVWLGTQNGLARFDGHRFEIYGHDPVDPRTLSGGFIMSLLEDAEGDLWVGTLSSGLNRLDRNTGTFVHHRHEPDNPASLGHDSVLAIHLGAGGSLWLGTGLGVDRYDVATGTFQHHTYKGDDPRGSLNNQIKALWEDHLGVLWLGTQGGLGRLDRESGQIVMVRQPGIELGQVLSLLEDRRGQLWIGAESGLFHWDRSRQAIIATPLRIDAEGASDRLVDEVITLHEDARGVLWLSTGRVVLGMSPESQGIVARHRAGEAESRLGDYVWDIAEDRSGGLWFGTRSGVSHMAQRHQVFTHYRPADATRRLGNVASVHEDRFGDLWAGTWGQGLHRFSPTAKLVAQYRHDAEDPASLSNDWVWTIYEDSRGDLWFGTNAGIDRLDRRNETFVRFQHRGDGPASFGPGGVGGMVEDPTGDLWVAKSSHLSRVDVRTGRLTQYVPDPADPKALGGQDLLALLIDQRGELWICSDGDGLLWFDRQHETFQRFQHDPADPASLSHDQVGAIHEDVRGTLWLGTLGGGVSWLEEERTGFRHLRQKDGLPSDWITGVQKDDHGNLWIGTDKGLARFDPASREVWVYDAADGALTGFSARAHGRSRSGALFFGGSQDLIAFLPDQVTRVEEAPTVFITGLRTFGSESTDKGRRPDLLPQPVRRAKASVVFSPEDYLFSIEFAALAFANLEKVRFAYQLEGFDSGWIPADASQPQAQYSRVEPGAYTFRVKAANRDGVWDETGAALAVTVLPAFWQTWWAYTLYALLVAGVVLAFVRSQRNKVAYERAASARLRQLDKLKDEFLANTSHELRTPLFGMTGLAESLVDGVHGQLPEAARTDLSMLVASGRRLSALVDDILDFSRLREKSLELRQQAVDLRSLAEVVLDMSGPLKGSKALQLVNNIPAELPAALADESRLQQVLYNLIGNAIKFSEMGTIEVSAAPADGELVVRVADQGIGISADKQDSIFEAFEQADASVQREYGGTGLGLAVTRQLVELHGGRLWLESVVGEGSTFFFSLPEAPGIADPAGAASPADSVGELGKSVPATSPPSAIEPVEVGSGSTEAAAWEPADDLAQRILVVDDEPVNRQVLSNHLNARRFRVTQASSGPRALRYLAEETFDLVLLDVMMPRMSGYEVCRRLRGRFTKQQLPVIFLTARNQTRDLVAGLEVGANDYLSKPVPKDELLARVRTHLDLLSIHRELEEASDERGRLLAERGELIDTLQARNAELASFNHAIAHDLSNPLTTIRNYLGLAHRAAREGETEQLAHNLRRVDVAADQLHRQFDALFEISSIGHVSDLSAEVALDGLAREACALLADAARERGAEVSIGDPLPVVRGDRAQLLAVFRHLLDNALKFLGDSPAPRIEVGVRREGETEAVYVRDNGLGIAPHYHARVFEVFEQLDADSEGIGV
ncbi:MAG: two-component regulator propeller domain-containing protein, partial [Acidobacteriota bacterium]